MEQVPFDLQERAAPRVLLFSVDDTLLAVHLGWVEAVLPGHSAEVYTVAAPGGAQAFVVHRGEPAFVLEPRVLFGLTTPAEANGQRAAHLVLRSGSHLLALRIDECVGVQEVDLQRCVPVPSALTSDGGVPIGHLLDLDGRAATVLDPSRLLDGAAREHLTRAAREAKAYLERESRIAELWREIDTAPLPAGVRKYARLCRQNGRTRRARAARAVLKAMAAEDAADPVAGNGSAPHAPHADGLTILLLRLERGQQSAEVAVEDGAGGRAGTIAVQRGRVIDATTEREQGLPALAELLGLRDAALRMAPRPGDAGLGRLVASTTASLIDALARQGERRGRD